MLMYILIYSDDDKSGDDDGDYDTHLTCIFIHKIYDSSIIIHVQLNSYLINKKIIRYINIRELIHSYI